LIDLKSLLPLVLGILVVFQPALNRQIMDRHGLGYAIVTNHTTLFVLAMISLGITLALGDRIPDILRLRTGERLQWWYLIPGVIAFTLTALVPFAITSVGAVATVVGMLAGQLLTSLVWDAVAEGRPPTWSRVIGMSLAMAGALFTFRK
jgi:transporter family-2 protein